MSLELHGLNPAAKASPETDREAAAAPRVRPESSSPATAGRDAAELRAALAAAPWRFDFFQALRRIQCVYRDRPRLGRSTRASEDPIRLGQQPSLKFPPTSLAAYRLGEAGRPDRLSTYFFGLFGPNGPLPIHLTEYALERRRDVQDVTFARFADLFHHRLHCLFFRAWADAQPTVSFDRPESDRFAAYVGSLFGMGTPELRHRDAMPDLTKLHFAGLLAARTRHPEGLVRILTTFFQVPVRLRQFVGHWRRLPVEYQCRLGGGVRTGRLGQSATIGTRVWDCQSRFGLTIGPVSLKTYLKFLPGGSSLDQLVAIVRNTAGDELAWDLRLVLKQDEVPAARLDGTSGLGRTSWLLGQPAPHDADDFVFLPQEAA